MSGYDETIGWQAVIAILIIGFSSFCITAMYQGQVTERKYAELGYVQKQQIGSSGYIWSKP